MSKQTEKRRELSYDGRGINGPDEYRSRIATFTTPEAAKTYGPLFEATPELLAAAKLALKAREESHSLEADPVAEALRAAIAAAERKGVER